MKIRIVFLFTSCKKKGPTKQTLNIIKNLDKNIFEPILVTLYKDSPDDSLLKDYLEVVDNHYSIESSAKKILSRSKKPIYQLFDRLEVDIIHSVGLVPAIVAQKYNHAIHFTTIRNFVYDDYVTKFGKITGTIMAKMHLSIIKSCHYAYTCSESLSLLYKEKLNINLPFIRNGVDIKNYPMKTGNSHTQIRRKLSLPIDKKIIIYTGQFISRKDQNFAIEGFLQSENSEKSYLLLLGDGPNYQNLLYKYQENENIIFVGNVPNVSEYLQASDIYISTSKSEGLPNGVLEAMATGLPVLLSDILQHKEIYEISPKIGILYQLRNQKDFSTKLDLIMDENLDLMGRESYLAVCDELNAEIMSKRYQNEYKEAFIKKHY